MSAFIAGLVLGMFAGVLAWELAWRWHSASKTRSAAEANRRWLYTSDKINQ